jgi:hypothetical protein
LSILTTISNLLILIAVVSMALLVVLELTSPRLGLTNIVVNRKNLQKAALFMGAVFAFAVVIEIAIQLMGL